MRTFEISIPIDEVFLTPIPNYFYNSPEYLQLEPNETALLFVLRSEKTKVIIARICFDCKNGIAKSHWRAPFGFLETNLVREEILVPFWRQVEKRLKECGVSEVLLTSWPQFYEPRLTLELWTFLGKMGFENLYTDYNFHLLVSEKAAIDHFLKPEKKRLRKCRAKGFIGGQWLRADGSKVYDLLSQFRQQKNIPLNITKEGLVNSFLSFPDKYLVFVVKEGATIIALSVCLVVNDDILYHFCLACDTAYHLFSPSVLLYETIYTYCQKNGYEKFDFGTASLQGHRQEGLYQFKEKLGGIVSLKPVFSKLLV